MDLRKTGQISLAAATTGTTGTGTWDRPVLLMKVTELKICVFCTVKASWSSCFAYPSRLKHPSETMHQTLIIGRSAFVLQAIKKRIIATFSGHHFSPFLPIFCSKSTSQFSRCVPVVATPPSYWWQRWRCRHRGKQDLGSLLRKVDPTITTQRAPWIPWIYDRPVRVFSCMIMHHFTTSMGKMMDGYFRCPLFSKPFIFVSQWEKTLVIQGVFAGTDQKKLRSLLYSKKSAMMEMMWWLSMSTLADLWAESRAGETIQFLGFQKSPKPETKICQM